MASIFELCGLMWWLMRRSSVTWDQLYNFYKSVEQVLVTQQAGCMYRWRSLVKTFVTRRSMIVRQQLSSLFTYIHTWFVYPKYKMHWAKLATGHHLYNTAGTHSKNVLLPLNVSYISRSQLHITLAIGYV